MKEDIVRSLSWTLVLLSMFIQGGLFRATCFPLIYHDDNWKDKLGEEMGINQKNFQQMIETIELKFKGTKNQERIWNAIIPISDAMKTIGKFDGESKFDNRLKWHHVLGNVGLNLLPRLKNFAKSTIVFNEQLKESDLADLTIKYELNKIRKSFISTGKKIEDYLPDDRPGEKFNISFHEKFSKVKNAFISYIDNPDIDNKNVLRHECNTTNGMKDVLTDIHIEIVDKEGNNGTFKELLHGGVSLKNFIYYILFQFI